MFDFIDIFKNVRNNWIRVENQQLSFANDDKEYIAYWADIKAFYEEDRLTLDKINAHGCLSKTLTVAKCSVSVSSALSALKTQYS